MTISQGASPEQSGAVPFRILPSTGPRPLRLLSLVLVLLLAGAFIWINIGVLLGKLPPVGHWGGFSWKNTDGGKPSADAAWLGMTICSVVATLALLNLLREIIYLRPDSRYWIEVSSETISFVSPLTSRRYLWQELSPFTVRVCPLRSWRVVRVTTRASRFRWVFIRSDDFATELADSRSDAAEVFAALLNDLPNQLTAGRSASVKIPRGLKVAAVAEIARKRLAGAAAVVRRGR